MSKIKIVTDSTADIPLSVRQRLDIRMAPLKVNIDGETYSDGITIHPETFYEKLANAAALPTTSQPSPVEFLEIYKSIMEEDGEAEIISVHLSSALSGTLQSAMLAKSLLDDNAKITMIDSKSASYGLGMLAVAAAEAAGKGASIQECVELIERMRSELRLYFLVDTLEYLQKGGRIGKAQALFGSLLNIKPILSVDQDGEVYAVDKVRGHKKAMSRIVELMKADFGDEEIALTVAHSNAEEASKQFGSYLLEHFRVKEIGYTSIGAVIGTHTGPGAVAAFAVKAR